MMMGAWMEGWRDGWMDKPAGTSGAVGRSSTSPYISRHIDCKLASASISRPYTRRVAFMGIWNFSCLTGSRGRYIDSIKLFQTLT